MNNKQNSILPWTTKKLELPWKINKIELPWNISKQNYYKQLTKLPLTNNKIEILLAPSWILECVLSW